MEKIGLIRREAHEGDARVSFVSIAPGGWQKLEEAIERAEVFCEDIIHTSEVPEIEKSNILLQKMSKRIG